MDIESVREFCLSLPKATEDFPFDESTLAFRVGGKIFAMIDLENTEWFVLKCKPEYALSLRERYADIVGAWHMNKKHWNQLNINGSLTNHLIESLIKHSYNEVIKKMSNKLRNETGLYLLKEEHPFSEI